MNRPGREPRSQLPVRLRMTALQAAGRLPAAPGITALLSRRWLSPGFSPPISRPVGGRHRPWAVGNLLSRSGKRIHG